ncbi:uncharacterized protein LOC121962904 [Plectropomus leopardus]|uniref:uncharacterized protein LOC121962904 n=1 Tax=Plectropomus leopardus TaxID=160734 RepID=UPI001C4BEF72|nr:uncharacterized protein LOC121962904 [Plectropomus leopardus]
METLSFPLENVTAGIYLKFFHCRVKGVIYQPNTVLDTDPAACRHQICDAASVVQTTTCGYSELCEGNFTCVPRPPVVCTVVGSTVIDFFNRTHSIPDRCKYNLFGLNASLTESVIVGFREQRRRDVPLLDHVTINYNREKFTLEQGGRVLGRKNMLMLNATAQLFNGVELSKDHAGVAVKWLSHNVEIFFDGSMVHIAAPFDLAAVGLCGNPTDNTETTRPAVSKNIAASAADCATPHKDAIDSTINCNRSTELCNHMMHAPFTPCHAEIDPQRYISACIDTLCRYPAVDGHKCHFMEAYAKSCSLKNIDLGSWRSMASCPAVPQTFHCLRHYCSDHEFCGIQYGQTHCLCRADFAAKYKPKNTLGDPTVCSQNSATLTLAGCLLEDKGIDYTVLHLNDPSCRGNMDPKSHMVTFEYDAMNTCGTEVTMNNHSQVIYTNTIKMRNGSNDIIVRHDQVEIDFSCMYRKPDIESVSFRIADSSVVQKIKSSIWNYTLTMSAYSNAGLTNLISPNTDIQLNQKVWLELKTTGLDDSMVSIVTDSCWATNQPSAVGGLHYDLVKNGCPDDPTVEVERSGRDTTNIVAFNMFQFSGQTGQIYLHCKLELCIKSTNTCAPVCGGSRRRRRSSRSSYVDENPALITMSWSN